MEEKKDLKSLKEHNEQRLFFFEKTNSNAPRPNGVACPKCGAELFDSNPLMKLTSIPPQKNVHCGECSYIGYRIL